MMKGGADIRKTGDRSAKVEPSRGLAYLASGFGLGILFNIGDPFITDVVVPGWPPIFFYGVPVIALLWVVLPFQTRPFGLSAALFLGLVFGFLSGTLLLIKMHGA